VPAARRWPRGFRPWIVRATLVASRERRYAMNVDPSFTRPPGRGRKIWSGTRHVIAYGMPAPGWRDLYHRALTVSWPVFFLSLATLFLVANTLFASLYLLGTASIANQSPAGFAGAFFFSVETLATVGYGDMHPQTVYAHSVATFEIFVGMSGIALATGLVFARFSRPRAKILFARSAIVRPLNGRMTLMVRVANARQNVIAEAHAKLRLMRVEDTHEGYTLRKIHDLTLVRNEHPIFLLGWSLMHVIDETSPLFGETAESLAARDAQLLITIEGSDETTAQMMQARHAWMHGEIRWHYRYVDLMHEADGITCIDYTRFNDIEPIDDADATAEAGMPGASVADIAKPRREGGVS
jgi:inward rectifier potassium channel